MVETISLTHTPANLPVYAALYSDVTNAGFLKQNLIAGNEAFEYAFIDANMILSRQHALAAAFRAINDYTSDRLKSRNVHSETVYSLSSNNNIGEAFRRFGIDDSTKNLLILKIPTKPGVTAESVEQHLSENIKGTLIPFDDEQLKKMTDLARLRKVYKLGVGQTGKSGKKGNAGVGDVDEVGLVSERSEIEVQVLGLMALRGAT